jgi:hypothetical protein
LIEINDIYICGCVGALGAPPVGHGAVIGFGRDVVCGGFPAAAGAAPGITGVGLGPVLLALGEFALFSPSVAVCPLAVDADCPFVPGDATHGVVLGEFVPFAGMFPLTPGVGVGAAAFGSGVSWPLVV